MSPPLHKQPIHLRRWHPGCTGVIDNHEQKGVIDTGFDEFFSPSTSVDRVTRICILAVETRVLAVACNSSFGGLRDSRIVGRDRAVTREHERTRLRDTFVQYCNLSNYDIDFRNTWE